MSGRDKLAELAAELLLRGVDTEKVLAIMQGAPAGKGVAAPPEPGHVGYKRRVMIPRENYVTHEQILAVLALGKDLTIDEISAQLPGAKHEAVHRHVGRALMLGTAMQVTKTAPFRFAATAAGKALAASPKKGHGKGGRGHGVPLEVVVEAMRGRGPLTANDIAEAVDGVSVNTARHHVARGMEKGLVQQHNTHPLSWSVAGKRQRVSRATAEQMGRGTPRVRVRSPGGPLKYEQVVNTIANLGQCTARELHAALKTTASLSAVRQHLAAAVREGLLIRAMEGKEATFTRKGGTRARALKPPPANQPKSESGANDAAIVAAIKAAGKPLDREGFIASSDLMRTMKPQSLYNALSTAVKRGFIRRVGVGLYDLAAGKMGPKAGKPSAGGNDAPAKQQSLALESDAKKPANGNGLNGGAHPAPS